MKSPLALAASVALLAACCGTGGPASPPVDLRTGAERAEAKSVAISLDGQAVCGGVWVAEDWILTSFHCVKNNGRPVTFSMLESLGVEVPAWDPKGQPAAYIVERGGKVQPAKILRYDADEDLALLAATAPWPKHEIAHVRSRAMRDGEELDIVGSTFGLAFSYCHGWVGASYDDYLQVSAPIFFGNSGGGAFDERGELVGIADHLTGNANGIVPGLAFFVPQTALRAFLKAS